MTSFGSIARTRFCKPGMGLWACSALLLAASAASAAPPGFVLDLPDGGQMPGAFVPTAAGDGLRQTLPWRASQLQQPLEFWLDEIIGIRSTSTAAAAERPAGFSLRMQGGDVLIGTIRSIDEQHVVLVPPAGDPVKIDRSLVSAIGRRTTGYEWPGGLQGWEATPKSSWRDEAGRITCDVGNASVMRNVESPARARVDMVLSWRETPQLMVAIAAGDGKQPDPFRFEMLSAGDAGVAAMLVRQEAGSGMLEPIELPAAENGRLAMTLFVDQVTGRMAAAVAGENKIVEVNVPPAKGREASQTFRIRLMSGDVCLERLWVSEWTSTEPRVGNPDATQVSLLDGSTVEGEIVSLDEAGQLVLETPDGGEIRELTSINSVIFAAGDSMPKEDGKPAEVAEEAEAMPVRVIRRSGGVLTGGIVGVTEEGLVMAKQGLDRPVVVPLDDLQSLFSLRKSKPRPLPGRLGTLKMDEVMTKGCLVDAARWGGGIAWQPRGSLVASPLAGATTGKISAVVEYVAPPATAPAGAAQVEVGGIGAVVNPDEDGRFVISMLSEDGAALRSGRIEPGDCIRAVQPVKDGPLVETKGIDAARIMNLLRGRVGTPIGLLIERDGMAKPQRVDFMRGLIYVAERSVLEMALAEHARVAAGEQAAAGQAAGYPSLVILRSGDILPAMIEAIDEAGIRLRSPTSGEGGRASVTVPNSLVRAIELDPLAGSFRITPERFQRLTMLPRSQQANPPSHLLRLGSEDYLRGQLESLTADEVVFTVLGQKKHLPRTAVARIIWLHPDEIEYAASGKEGEPIADDAADPDVASPADAGLLVQGVAGGVRMTLVAERMEEKVIVGTSLALGPSQIDTTRIDKLLIGREVTAGDDSLPFAQWRLRLAPLPRALRDEE
jgi:hypothetical protein